MVSMVRLRLPFVLLALCAACSQTPEPEPQPSRGGLSPIQWVTPVEGALLRGEQPLRVEHVDDGASADEVTFRVGERVIDVARAEPFAATWNTAEAPDGPVTLEAIASRADGERVQASHQVTIDNTPPTVALLSPRPGDRVASELIVRAAVEDTHGLAEVTLWLDGEKAGTRNAPPFDFPLEGLQPGAHELRIQSFDVAGNEANSAPVNVMVNAPPTIAFTSPAPGSPHEGSLTLTVAASDDVAVASVTFEAGGFVLERLQQPPWVLDLHTCDFPSGEQVFRAIATDDEGAQSEAALTLTLQSPLKLSGTAGNARALLSWDGCGGGTYDLLWSTAPEVTEASNAIADVTPVYVHAGLTNEQGHSYRVARRAPNRPGSISNEVRVWPSAAPAQCSVDGVCAQSNRPTGAMLTAIVSIGPSEAWAAGLGGTLLRWDGSTWTPWPHPAGDVDFTALGASGPSDVWAVGAEGMVLRFDGSAWRRIESGTTRGLATVWAHSPSEVWIGGDLATLLRWNGSALIGMSIPSTTSLRRITGSTSTDVWLGGTGGELLHWNGSAFTSRPVGMWTQDIHGLWSHSPTGTWTLLGLEMWRHDGTGWSRHSNLPFGFSRAVLDGTGPTDVLAAGLQLARWNGTGWEFHEHSANATAAISPGDAWFVGDHGAILRWTGSNLTGGANPRFLNALWSHDGADLFAVGEGGRIYRGSPSALSAMSSPTASTLHDVTGTGPQDVWAVGANGVVVRWDGLAWTQVGTNVSGALHAVAALGPGEVIAVGAGGQAVRLSPSGATPVSTGVTTTLRGVWFRNAQEGWAFGDSNTVLRWNGTAFTKEPYTRKFNALSGSPTGKRVFAVGDSGLISEWDGTKWVNRISGTQERLLDVFVVDDSRAFAVGAQGALLEFDGHTWKTRKLPGGASARAIWASESAVLMMDRATVYGLRR